MKINFVKIKLVMLSLAFSINFFAGAMDKPGIVPLQKLAEFLKDMKAQRKIDYSALSVLDIEKINKEVDLLLDRKQEQTLLGAAQSMQITPHQVWNNLQAIKRDLHEVGRIRKTFYDLLSKKNKGLPITYDKFSLNDLLQLRNEAAILLRPGYEALIVAAGRRADVEPAHVWEYITAIQKDLSLAIEEKIEAEHRSAQKRIVPISL